MINILAKILSHGFAVAIVALLAVGFIYRGELFPELQLPDFLSPESETVAEEEGAYRTSDADAEVSADETEALVGEVAAPDQTGAAGEEAAVTATGDVSPERGPAVAATAGETTAALEVAGTAPVAQADEPVPTTPDVPAAAETAVTGGEEEAETTIAEEEAPAPVAQAADSGAVPTPADRVVTEGEEEADATVVVEAPAPVAQAADSGAVPAPADWAVTEGEEEADATVVEEASAPVVQAADSGAVPTPADRAVTEGEDGPDPAISGEPVPLPRAAVPGEALLPGTDVGEAVEDASELTGQIIRPQDTTTVAPAAPAEAVPVPQPADEPMPAAARAVEAEVPAGDLPEVAAPDKGAAETLEAPEPESSQEPPPSPVQQLTRAPVASDAPVTAATPAVEAPVEATGTVATEAAAVSSAVVARVNPYQLLASAREAYWLHDYEQAETIYRELTALEPDNPDWYGELGNMYFSQGKWDESASAYYEAGARLVKAGRLARARDLVKVIRGLNGSQAQELEMMIHDAGASANQ
jgi:hypothetical protein